MPDIPFDRCDVQRLALEASVADGGAKSRTKAFPLLRLRVLADLTDSLSVHPEQPYPVEETAIVSRCNL